MIFIFGLAIGSFLNVLIYRLPRNESILGFSKCLQCRKKIAWHDNIPVVSFFVLKGRCQKCGSKIFWQYPLVELLTGFLFLFSFLVYRENPVFLIYVLFLISLLVAIAFIDLKHFLILDSLILSGFIISFIFIFFASSFSLPVSHFYGLLFFAGFFLFLFLITKGKGIGLGDVKLAAWLGFVFGFENSISVFYLTFFIGFICAIMLLVSKKAGLKSKMPLGSLMALASILFLLSGFNLPDFINSELILRLWLN
ncbi:MAG: prepilin peptidase [Patescibacteria group bacterium]